jgi:glyceraldehyde-3-phosphate dehydrogenase/erythrose-4-phosphate dehydrogenase
MPVRIGINGFGRIGRLEPDAAVDHLFGRRQIA